MHCGQCHKGHLMIFTFNLHRGRFWTAENVLQAVPKGSLMTFTSNLHWGGQCFITQELHQTGSEEKGETQQSHHIFLLPIPHQGTTERWNTIGSNFQYIFLYSDLVFQKGPRRNTIPWPEDVWESPSTAYRNMGPLDWPLLEKLAPALTLKWALALGRGVLNCRECVAGSARRVI